MRVFEITSREDLERAYPVFRELRPHIDKERFFELLEEMTPAGYRLLAREDEAGEIVAIAGIGRGVNFYYGRYIWVYELVTSERERSGGHGKALLDHIESLARSEGLDTIALSSALHRTDAHRFYEEKVGFDRTAYVFQKGLE